VRALRHALAILLLPVTVLVLVPASILWRAEAVSVGWGLPPAAAIVPVLLGAGLVGLGLALVIWTVVLFVRSGRGTLAPWDPTTRLVVSGPYRHVRNPISGVLIVLLGEAALLGSFPLLAWFAAAAAVNAVYIPLVEEPGLVRRYGAEFERYRASVPRWVPRRRAWQPPAGTAQPPP
jgi:protein-S-isoprenylcysteine O-methyltransferase Ste14